MKVWLISCGLLFILAQFIFWIKDIFLPLPIYVFAGAFLAIASNYDQGIISFLVRKTNTLSENNSLGKINSPSLAAGEQGETIGVNLSQKKFTSG